MDVERQGILLEYAQTQAVELPKEVLYDVVLEAAHDADPAAEAVQAAFRPFAGDARRSRLPWGPDLRFRHGAHNLDVRLRDGMVRVESRNRLQPGAMRRVVDAVASLPGVRDLRIEATVPQFSKGLSNLRACTPCQASRLR